MGFPSFPPSGRVVSLIEVLPLIGLERHLIMGHRILLRWKNGRTQVGRDEESLFRAS